MTDEDAKIAAEAYTAARRRIEAGNGTWMDDDLVRSIDDWMNGPHPMLDVLGKSMVESLRDGELASDPRDQAYNYDPDAIPTVRYAATGEVLLDADTTYFVPTRITTEGVSSTCLTITRTPLRWWQLYRRFRWWLSR